MIASGLIHSPRCGDITARGLRSLVALGLLPYEIQQRFCDESEIRQKELQ